MALKKVPTSSNRSKRLIEIVHLYPNEMNIYGDTGNLMALVWRLQQRGITHRVIRVGINQSIPTTADILIGGGGQDSGQLAVRADIKRKAPELMGMANDGTTMLVICGTYQLFGHYFQPHGGERIDGIGLFDAYTEAGNERLIGNVVVSSPFGKLVGFENHSGRTTLHDGQLPLGKVVRGFGNDGKSSKEGAVVKNVFGSYLHGPLLPKNPEFADELIRRALERKYGKSELMPIDDYLAHRAAAIAAKRP